jgi:hypothetical protein
MITDIFFNSVKPYHGQTYDSIGERKYNILNVGSTFNPVYPNVKDGETTHYQVFHTDIEKWERNKKWIHGYKGFVYNPVTQ